MQLLTNDWPTKSEDMDIAEDIISKHLEMNDGEPLGMLEVVIDKSKGTPIELRIPEWIKEIYFQFRDQYGYELGPSITGKVLTRFMLKNETIH
jgi:hypothetical protein